MSAEAPTAALPLVVNLTGAKALLNCKTTRSFHRECRDIGLVAYRRGKYRVRDIENALAKAARRAQERTGKGLT
jgi:hypothetical protein